MLEVLKCGTLRRRLQLLDITIEVEVHREAVIKPKLSVEEKEELQSREKKGERGRGGGVISRPPADLKGIGRDERQENGISCHISERRLIPVYGLCIASTKSKMQHLAKS